MGSEPQSEPRAQQTWSHLLPRPAAQPSSLPSDPLPASEISLLSNNQSSRWVIPMWHPIWKCSQRASHTFQWWHLCVCFLHRHTSALLHTCLFILCEGPRPIAQQEPPECRTPHGVHSGPASEPFPPRGTRQASKVLLSPWSRGPDLEAVVWGQGSDFPSGCPWLLQPTLELSCSRRCQAHAWLVFGEHKHRNNQGVACTEEKGRAEMRGRTAEHGL